MYFSTNALLLEFKSEVVAMPKVKLSDVEFPVRDSRGKRPECGICNSGIKNGEAYYRCQDDVQLHKECVVWLWKRVV